jgi:hypothetical protein
VAMKKIYFLYLTVFFSNFYSQVFTGAGGSVLNNGGQETPFNINVVGLSPANIDSVFGVEEVCISLNHAAVEELNVYLISPSGIKVELTGVLTCSGTNYSNTCFNNHHPNSITTAGAPYSGVFRPVGNLGRFNTGKPGNGGWKLFVKDFVAPGNQGTLLNWSIKFSYNPAKPVMLHSSNLPLVFLNTNGQNLKDDDIIVDFGVIDNGPNRNNINDPKNNYNGKAAAHLRGSSSKMFEKNNIKVELKDASGVNDVDASLLGMPAESDWILTACYSDKSLLRNALTQHLYSQMGHYSPRYRFVELVLNGEYFGVYMLMEQIKRGKDRVAISKTTPLDNQFPYVTGGYIVQINRTDDPGWYSLHPGISNNNAKFYYQYNYPRSEEITPQQQGYIKAVLDTFENVMASPSFADPNNGYTRYVRENTFVDYFILNELSKNPDAYRLSTYLYKENAFNGGKISIGPVWDYDISWHNANFGNASSHQSWQYQVPNSSFPIPTWWTKFMTDASFKDKLYCRYHSLRQNVLSNSKIYEYIDGMAVYLDEAQKRNFRQFPILGAYIYPNPQNQNGANYATEVSDLKTWVANRSGWLDTSVPGFCANVGVEELLSFDSDLIIYPNPFSESFKIKMNLGQKENAKLELYNLLGDRLMNITISSSGSGEISHELEAGSLSEGTYIIKIDIGKRSYYKKIIKV